MADRLVVTHEGRLARKYGKEGLQLLRQAVEALAAADAKRGLGCRWIALPAVAGRARSFKEVIDEVAAQNDILILGGPDVVPHQRLTNPVGDDGDDAVPSDLPYACAVPYGTKAEAFLAPSRSVGRIPDLPGESEPSRLVAGIEAVRTWTPRPRGDYGSCFALSAAEWKRSTTQSVRALFGPKARLRTSPKEGPVWKPADLRPLVHFINCHGAEVDPQYYGQEGDDFPVAHRAALLRGAIGRGTLIAAECCYGAELFDPSGTTAGIAATCLREGAIAFCGSTTIAYGPSDSMGEADLLCRYFLEAVLSGERLGRALLDARLRFAKEGSPLSPVGLKTLAQFVLLGDPSLRVVAGPVKRTAALRPAFVPSALSSGVVGRGETARQLTQTARSEGFVPGPVRTHPVNGAKSPTLFHLLRAERPRRRSAKRTGIPSHVLFVAREVGGRIVGIERLYAHR